MRVVLRNLSSNGKEKKDDTACQQDPRCETAPVKGAKRCAQSKRSTRDDDKYLKPGTAGNAGQRRDRAVSQVGESPQDT